ncbi:MAG: homoserine O-succinyltransferase [Pseudomonadota bacterium]
MVLAEACDPAQPPFQTPPAARSPGEGSASVITRPPSKARRKPADAACPSRDYALAPPADWRGACGAQLPDGVVLKVRVVGPADAPAVAVSGGISATCAVADDAASGEAGWWRDLARAGAPLDPARIRIVSMEHVFGDGRAPLDLTPADQASLWAHVLDELGVARLSAFVGASFGGMVALSFARAYPARLDRLAVIAAAHRPAPMAQAWRAVQRDILAFAEKCGAPEEGVALARALAMTTYRSAGEFNTRFSCADGPDGGVADYLRARGGAYRERFSAAAFTTLSASIDRHFERPEEIDVPALIVGITSDQIAPIADVRELAARLGGPAAFVALSSVYGHDGFLKDAAALAPHLAEFLAKG